VEGANLVLFLVAALALNLTPGPDMLYVLANGLAGGGRGGALAALGISAGCVVHAVAAVAGLTALAATMPAALIAIKLAGAAYLVWLGIDAWRHPPALTGGATVAPGAGLRIFRQGFVTNALNPKVALFFLAFLPQFVSASGWPTPLQILTLGALFIVQGTIVLLAVALAAGALRRQLVRQPRLAGWIGRISGSLMIGLGLRLALGELRR
jgi:threonine/homoserine/homoserine lactone efflux protein